MSVLNAGFVHPALFFVRQLRLASQYKADILISMNADANKPGRTALSTPPLRENFEGAERHVGVEIETAAVVVDFVASAVQRLYGGEVEKSDPNRLKVRDTKFGDFTVELDAQILHASDEDNRKPVFKDKEWEAQWRDLTDTLRDAALTAAGKISSAFVPCEIISPPLVWSELGDLDRLVKMLRRSGAEGTRRNPAYAFGMQLNPDIAENSADYILSIMRAWMLLSDVFREEMQIDLTRRILTYTDPFPESYRRHVCKPGYAPDTATLIDDYLKDNPTRNRDLDMLPLFAWLDEDRVQDQMDEPLIKPRPTFHYRLPDCRIDEEGWGVAVEWNRWVRVEELAADTDRLEQLCAAYTGHDAPWKPAEWAQRAIGIMES